MAWDPKAYMQELAKKAGLTEEQTKPILEALGNEAFAKEVQNGFVTRPDFSRELDTVSKTAKQREAELNEWYEKQAKPAFEANLKGQDVLKKYQELYGPLDPNIEPPNGKPAVTPSGLTKQEVEELLKTRDTAYVQLMKDVGYMTAQHLHTFNEPLDMDAVQQVISEAATKGETLSPRQAYQRYVEPRAKERQEAAHKKEIEEAEQRGFQKALSTHKLPIDNRPKEPHLIFDRKAPDPNVDSEQHSRNAFVDGWNEAQSGATSI